MKGNIFCYNLDSKDIVHFVSLHESFLWGMHFEVDVGCNTTTVNQRRLLTERVR